MSSNSNAADSDSSTANDVAVGREVAYRLFAAEYDDASMSHTESDEERAPNYVITPTGARINRMFVVGTLTEVTPVNDEMVRARVVDPTGAFVVYAGQYQPEALAFLEGAEPPLFVAVTGKARTFQPDDSDRVYTSIRPESISTVDADTRDRWVVSSAEQTLERVASYATAATVDARGDELADVLLESGLDAGLSLGIPLAQDHYGTTPDYLEGLRTLALDAVRVVADDLGEVRPFDLNPGDSTPDSSASFDALAAESDFDVEPVAVPSVSADASSDAEAEAEPASAAASTGDAVATADGTGETTLESESEPGSESEFGAESEPATDVDAGLGSDTESEPEPELESAVDATEAAAETDSETQTEETSASFDETTDVADSDEFEGGAEEDEPATESESESDTATGTDNDLADYSGEMYEMDDEERAELEEEFGAEFSTGTEIEEPGEVDLEAEAEVETEAEPESTDLEAGADDVDDVDDADDEGDEGDTLGDFQPESEGLADEAAGGEDEDEDEDEATEPAEDAADADADAEPLEDVDLQEYAVDTMRDLDDGDGADRSTVVERVVAETGADEEDVEGAIADALMGGQCYEPNDETLKAI